MTSSPACGRARRHLRAHYARDPNLRELAAVAHFSRFHFHRAFVRAIGVTPKRLAMRLRIAEAKRRLRAGEPAAAVARAVSFANQSRFTQVFRKELGVPPVR